MQSDTLMSNNVLTVFQKGPIHLYCTLRISAVT